MEKGLTEDRQESERMAEKYLSRVPEDYVFYCCDGRSFRDLRELAAGLVAMSDSSFAYHVHSNKNDFSNWVRDIIRDEELADELVRATTRFEAIGRVTTRMAMLTRGLP
jgi:hypothetical protein